MPRPSMALLVTIAVLAAAGCGGSGSGSRAVDGVTDLTSVDQFREAFEAGKGKTRLVLLLSPT